jgi:hypothetical protein
MSEMEDLVESVSGAVTAAQEAATCAANADELCSRITAQGAAIGFHNDPTFVFTAQQRVVSALGQLSLAVTELEEANALAQQA